MTTPRHTDTHRTCYRCEKLGRPARHPVAEFTQRSNGTFFSACKACNREMGAERRAAERLEREKAAASAAGQAWLARNYKKGAK